MNLNENIRCPITDKIFFESVMASNGITFEATIKYIEEIVFKQKHIFAHA